MSGLRTSLPGRAPVCTPSMNVITPSTTVMSSATKQPQTPPKTKCCQTLERVRFNHERAAVLTAVDILRPAGSADGEVVDVLGVLDADRLHVDHCRRFQQHRIKGETQRGSKIFLKSRADRSSRTVEVSLLAGLESAAVHHVVQPRGVARLLHDADLDRDLAASEGAVAGPVREHGGGRGAVLHDGQVGAGVGDTRLSAATVRIRLDSVATTGGAD